MPLNNTQRSRTDQVTILTSIVDRLIDQIEELTVETCWLSDQPIPISLPQGRFAVTVSVGAGRFPNEFFAGGGVDTLTEDGQIIICPLIVNTGDRPRRKWKKITGNDALGETGNASPSILYFKQEILKALLADNDWEPNNGTAPILRDMISPISCDDPRDVPIGETIATAMKIRFSTVFDWDLS